MQSKLGCSDGTGGEIGIRTREEVYPLTHLAGGRFRPLSHLSAPVRVYHHHNRQGMAVRLRLFGRNSDAVAACMFVGGIACGIWGHPWLGAPLWAVGVGLAVLPFIEVRLVVPREIEVHACWKNVRWNDRSADLLVTPLEVWVQLRSPRWLPPTALRIKRSSILTVRDLDSGLAVHYLDAREERCLGHVSNLDEPGSLIAILGFGRAISEDLEL